MYEELIRQLRNSVGTTKSCDECPGECYGNCIFEDAADAIEELQADVRPVVRGKWVYTDMSRLVCSNCGNPIAFSLKEDGWHHGDFCPNCGADMRPELPKAEEGE